MSTQERGLNASQPQENQPPKEVLLDNTHALLAPGQGNQRIGMGSDLASRSEAAAGVWRRVDDLLRPDLGYSLSEKVWRGSAADISDNAQLAIITDALARKAALEESGLLENPPGWHAGNSLGFITALVNVGALSMEGAAHLARGRTEAFRLVTNGEIKTTMVSLVDVNEGITQEIVEKHNLVICLINNDRQVVVGGTVENIEDAKKNLKDEYQLEKDNVFPMGVNAAYHSRYMEPALPFWTEVVNSAPIEEPKSGIVVGGSTVKKLLTPEDIRTELIIQLTNTERYADVVRFLRAQGVTQMTELNGIGRLSHINKDLFGEGSRERITLLEGKTIVGHRWVAPAIPDEVSEKPVAETVSRDSIQRFYYEWVSNRAGIDPKEISGDMSFTEGAGLDSEDLKALRAALRAEYGRNVSDEEAAQILTIGAGIDATYKLMNS